MKATSIAVFIPAVPNVASVRLRAARLRVSIVTAAVAAVLTACAASPEQAAWEIADAHARWLDRFHSDRRTCERQGGFIVQERHMPDALRLGPREPEVGSRYWCVVP